MAETANPIALDLINNEPGLIPASNIFDVLTCPSPSVRSV